MDEKSQSRHTPSRVSHRDPVTRPPTVTETTSQVEGRLAGDREGGPDDWLDDVLPRTGPPMSEHLALEIEQAFTDGPLEPGEPVDGCTCGLCMIPDLPPYVNLDDVA